MYNLLTPLAGFCINMFNFYLGVRFAQSRRPSTDVQGVV